MIRNAASLLHWAEAIKQEEHDLRVWMRSSPKTSRIMDYIDYIDVLPSLVVPFLKAYKERYLSGDPLPDDMLRAMINDLHDFEELPFVVSVIPSDWDTRRINMREFAVIIMTMDKRYPDLRDELNGENWKANSLAMIKATSVLEVSSRGREQKNYLRSGGQGHIRPDVGDRYFSENMARFILDNPEQAEDIANIILTRKTRDFDLIKSILESDAMALSEGIL